RDVVIYDLSDPALGRTIYADSGRMAFNQDRTDLFLTLYDGVVHEVRESEPESFQRLFYDRQRIRLEGVGNRLEEGLRGSYRSDREMSIGMLREEIERRRAELEEVREQARTLVGAAVRRALAGPAAPEGALLESVWTPAAAALPAHLPRPSAAQLNGGGRDDVTRRVSFELQSLSSRYQTLLAQMNEYGVEYHKKFSIPFACIVFILVGAPISVRYPRGGVGMVIAVSLTVFTIYYMGLIGGESLGDEGLASPGWAMWAPNVLFLLLAFWGLARISREAATGRICSSRCARCRCCPCARSRGSAARPGPADEDPGPLRLARVPAAVPPLRAGVAADVRDLRHHGQPGPAPRARHPARARGA